MSIPRLQTDQDGPGMMSPGSHRNRAFDFGFEGLVKPVQPRSRFDLPENSELGAGSDPSANWKTKTPQRPSNPASRDRGDWITFGVTLRMHASSMTLFHRESRVPD
jgi:hypothetical protein